jgi:hypothetical protein
MSTIKTGTENSLPKNAAKWVRRDKKKRPKMAVHGRNLKKLAQQLNDTRR